MQLRNEKPVAEQDIQQFLLEESEKSRLAREITKELQGAKYKDFFAQFDEESVKLFVQVYASKKSQYLRYAPQCIEEQEQKISDAALEAMERLWEIQQKKLFDLQCLWRAEQIQIPGVDVCFDFRYWEKNISACPFLDPITTEEVELYIAYSASELYSEMDPLLSWQDYEGFRMAGRPSGVTLPAWYSFYDQHMGNGDLLQLPDLRGQKERAYLYPSYTETCYEPEIIGYSYEEITRKPILDLYAPGVLQDFIRQFENRKLMDYCIAYETELKKKSDIRAVESAIEILKNAGEDIPISASSDWKNAILEAAFRYEKKQLARNIHLAYEEYRLREESGIAQFPTQWAAQEELYADMLESRKQEILAARIRQGEPANFDF